MSVTRIPRVATETYRLYRRFDDVTVLDDISLRIVQGGFIAIMGASGSDKITLVNILTCLDTATGGQVFLDGTGAAALDEEGRRRSRVRKAGLVLQQFRLIPFSTTLENITLTQHYHSVVDEAAARKVLEQVRLGHRVMYLPSQLSGGEQQRVCTARALINEPPVIFADGLAGSLDEENERRMLDLLTDLYRQGRVIVTVTHNPAPGQFVGRTLQLQHGKYLGEETNRHALV